MSSVIEITLVKILQELAGSKPKVYLKHQRERLKPHCMQIVWHTLFEKYGGFLKQIVSLCIIPLSILNILATWYKRRIQSRNIVGENMSLLQWCSNVTLTVVYNRTNR